MNSPVTREMVAALNKIEATSLSAKFYLVGGTALALHLEHRSSTDLDFFTLQSLEELPSSMDKSVRKTFTNDLVEKTLAQNSQQNWLINEVKITFVAFPFEPIRPVAKWGNISMASVLDIAAMKVYSMGRRNTARDYIDMYYILTQTKYSLTDIINAAKIKFNKDDSEPFEPLFFLQQLSYTKDLRDTEEAISMVFDDIPFSKIAQKLGELGQNELKAHLNQISEGGIL